jgi:hypothetical protein
MRSQSRHTSQVNRRQALVTAGAAGLTGLTLTNLLRKESRATGRGGRNKQANSVILLWMRGGPSQHETWDPKPDAPVEFRGAFGARATSVPGTHIVDMLPKCAAIQHKWSIIRSLHHGNAGHSAGDQIVFTGHPPGSDPSINVHPSCGAITSQQLGHLNPELPAYVMIPRQVPGTDSAYLGAAHKPFETLADPATKGAFKLKNFTLQETISNKRFADRKGLLREFDQFKDEADSSGQMESLGTFQQKAYSILASDRARAAFDIDSESAEVRERYGFVETYNPMDPRRCSASPFNQRFLLARRLVEAGVRLVTVDCRWWDTHVQGIDSMKNGFLPRWDQAYSALINDLEERGMLDTTMVLAWGEFGRTPRVNKDNGRDHYPNVFSAAIAGGTVQGGRVVGSSDAKGAFPKDRPVTPQDVLATLYDHVGVDTHRHYLDHSGRPVQTLPFGDPITELL